MTSSPMRTPRRMMRKEAAQAAAMTLTDTESKPRRSRQRASSPRRAMSPRKYRSNSGNGASGIGDENTSHKGRQTPTEHTSESSTRLETKSPDPVEDNNSHKEPAQRAETPDHHQGPQFPSMSHVRPGEVVPEFPSMSHVRPGSASFEQQQSPRSINVKSSCRRAARS